MIFSLFAVFLSAWQILVCSTCPNLNSAQKRAVPDDPCCAGFSCSPVYPDGARCVVIHAATGDCCDWVIVELFLAAAASMAQVGCRSPKIPALPGVIRRARRRPPVEVCHSSPFSGDMVAEVPWQRQMHLWMRWG